MNLVQQAASSGNAVIAAITDVKTVRIDKAQCNYRLGVYGGREIIPAVEKKAGATRNSYLKRSMKLDDKLALGEASKPFSNARPS